jgi:signal transduction histidine kinase/CheY-like chemotaxis protein
MRAVDWVRTSLGPVETWPSSLRTTVGMLSHSPQPMFLWWGPELIQFYNDAYLPHFHFGEHPAAMGRRARDTWPDQWPIIGPKIDDMMNLGTPSWNEDVRVPIFRNGTLEETYWTYGHSPVFDEAGGIGGVLVICTETTERVVAARREQAARQAAEVANRAKDEFLATVSHELRTPLTAMLGWARMLMTGKVPSSRYEHALRVIERNAVAQARLIEDLLDVSRITAGNMRIHRTAVDLVKLVESAMDSIKPVIDAKSIELHSALGPVTSTIMGDPNRLQQVIWNLLVNAAKFTHKGGHIQVTLECADSAAELRVDDDGQGISAEFLAQVFDRFKQADQGGNRSHQGGLGLGLAISRHLVELHGGSLHARSDGPGCGSSFSLKLPLTASPDLAASRSSPGGETSFEDARELEGLRVLVVDDEADTREFLMTVLADCGAIPLEASSAAEALEVLAEHRPDVLISDIGMPGEDGYSLIRRARLLPLENGAGIPAAALTAYTSDEDRSQALVAGYQMHLPKPVDPAELVAVVASLARIARSIK